MTKFQKLLVVTVISLKNINLSLSLFFMLRRITDLPVFDWQ